MTQTALQPYTGEEEKFEVERQRLLAAYDASEKLAKWTARDRSGKSVIIQYYPANWRLYELRLRYPSATIETEIVHMDIEKDFVIVRAWIFTGLTYAESYGPGHKRASGLKQGKLTIIDKVETGAKARAARDFGIGTEHALDMDDGEIEASVTVIEDRQPQTINAPMPSELRARAKELGKDFDAVVKFLFKKSIADEDLTPNDCQLIHAAFEKSAAIRKQAAASTNGK